MDARGDSILYIETDIPPRMTCADYRRVRRPVRRRMLRDLVRRRRSVTRS